MGQCKEKKPKAKGRLKKLARKQGSTRDEVMMDHEGGIGSKHRGKLEYLEQEEDRKIMKRCEEVFTSDALVFAETVVVGRQHREEP